MALSVRVRLIGVFRLFSGRNLVRVTLEEGATISDVIKKLVESFPPEFEEALRGPVLGEPWPSTLILLDGREIGVLEGVETTVKNSNEIAFVPVTHGG